MAVGRIIGEKDAEHLRRKFRSEMENEVLLLLFTGGANPQYSRWTERLLAELSQLDERIRVKVVSISEKPELARKYGVPLKRSPTILVSPDRYMIRYTGAPVGHEAWAFIETIVMASRGESGLSPESEQALRELSQEYEGVLHSMVFVTPACPYCPRQALLSNRIAVALPGRYHSEVVEAMENPDLADKYGVSAVPDTVVLLRNGGVREVLRAVGAHPEELFISKLVTALVSPD